MHTCHLPAVSLSSPLLPPLGSHPIDPPPPSPPGRGAQPVRWDERHCFERHLLGLRSLPLVLLVHGMNKVSTFWHVRFMMRTATRRGWIAVCMNLRGQDGLGEVKIMTPRGVSEFRGFLLLMSGFEMAELERSQ